MKTNRNINSAHINHSKFVALVEKIDRENNTRVKHNGSVESILRYYFYRTSKKRKKWKRETFKTLLMHLYTQRCYSLLRDFYHVGVLHAISSYGNVMLRPLEDWESATVDNTKQIRSLIVHCFTKYHTPEFLESAFFTLSKTHMFWYIQLGRGKSVNDLAGMPFQMTNKMAHEFRHAPGFLSVNQALCYAQARGFGAGMQQAKLIAFSKLSETLGHENVFWQTVVQFFSRVEVQGGNEIGEIVDYINYRYREDSSFSMRKRSLNALKQQTQTWHRALHLEQKGEELTWKASGLKPLYIEEEVDGKHVVFKTVELTRSSALFDEGVAMQHCVADYDYDCVDGTCSIFSLRKEENGQTVQRMATLEVSLPDLEIVQAKAKYNAEPTSKAIELINRWINERKLPHEQRLQMKEVVRHGRAANKQAERQHMSGSLDRNYMWSIYLIIWLLYFYLRHLI